MKKFLIFLSLSILLLVNQNPTIISANNKSEYRLIEELDNLPYNDTLSYQEMLEYYLSNNYDSSVIEDFTNNHEAILQNIQVSKSNNNVQTVSSTTEIRYSLFRMKTFSFSYPLWSTCKVQARFSVGLEYDIGAISPNKIVTISGEHAYTGGGDKCVFAGSIFYRLEAGNRFYYSIYGNLYKKGDINWTVGGTVKVGEYATVSASISNGDGYINNISEHETYISTGMSN